MSEKICKRCVLPESKPDIYLNEAGICNVCLNHDQNKTPATETVGLETDFVKIINQYKGKYPYDCLVMCSGGKDSTSALYYIKKRYKLNPLAFTFDHGFETTEALDNIHKAVEKLDIEFLFFRSTFMKDMFKLIIDSNSKAVICHLCSIWYMDLTYQIAEKFNIPIIIAGWTKGQSTTQPVLSKCACNIFAPEYASMAKATKDFLENQVRNHPKYKDFPQSMEEVVARAKKRHKCLVLSPHWFLPMDLETKIQAIQKELGWTYPKNSYPAKSTNCLLNYLSVDNSLKYYGFTHYHVEMSKMIRDNLLTREEALEMLKKNYDQKTLDEILAKINS